MSRLIEPRYFCVCTDCGSSYPVSTVHKCRDKEQRVGQRLAAEMLDQLIVHLSMLLPVQIRAGQLGMAPINRAGAGLLWLYRIAYRVRSQLNGLEKYKDRAELARIACELGGELYK